MYDEEHVDHPDEPAPRRRRGRGCLPGAARAGRARRRRLVRRPLRVRRDQLAPRPAPDYAGPGTGTVLYQVKDGATSADIGRELKAKGVVKSVDAFNDAAAVQRQVAQHPGRLLPAEEADEGQRGARRPGQPGQPDPEPGRRPRGCAGAPDREDDRRQDRHLQEGRHRGAGQPQGDRPARRGQRQPRGLPLPGDLHGAAQAERRRPDQADGRQGRRGRAVRSTWRPRPRTSGSLPSRC